MSTIHKRVLLLLALLSSPSFAFAVGNVGFDGLNALIMSFANGVVRSTGYMMFTLAVVAFFFGIVQFIWASRQGSEGKGIQRGKQFMMWGLIGLFVMFSVWGIVKFAQGVFGIQGDNTIIIPSLDFKSSGVQGVTGSGNLFSTGSNVATGITTSGITTQAQANQLYDYCLKNGGNSTACANAANNALANNPTYNGTIPSTGAAANSSNSATVYAKQNLANQAYYNCLNNSGATPETCMTGALSIPGSNAQSTTVFANCLANGGDQATCQTASQASNTGVTAASQAYNSCVNSGKTVDECNTVYTNAGGVGSGQQNLANQVYANCTSNGGDSATCQTAAQAALGDLPAQNSASSNSSSNTVTAAPGGDCTTDAECGTGGKCVNYACQVGGSNQTATGNVDSWDFGTPSSGGTTQTASGGATWQDCMSAPGGSIASCSGSSGAVNNSTTVTGADTGNVDSWDFGSSPSGVQTASDGSLNYVCDDSSVCG